nr:histidine-rich glycoprotein-like [Danaus plexippus plexippus]
MKLFIFISLLIAVEMASSTITLDKLTEKVQAGLKILKEKAVTKLHKIKEGIDLKKLHQFHVSHFLPYAHKHYVQEHYHKKTPLIIDPYQIHRLQHYFEPHHHKISPIHVHGYLHESAHHHHVHGHHAKHH